MQCFRCSDGEGVGWGGVGRGRRPSWGGIGTRRVQGVPPREGGRWTTRLQAEFGKGWHVELAGGSSLSYSSIYPRISIITFPLLRPFGTYILLDIYGRTCILKEKVFQKMYTYIHF